MGESEVPDPTPDPTEVIALAQKLAPAKLERTDDLVSLLFRRCAAFSEAAFIYLNGCIHRHAIFPDWSCAECVWAARVIWRAQEVWRTSNPPRGPAAWE